MAFKGPTQLIGAGGTSVFAIYVLQFLNYLLRCQPYDKSGYTLCIATASACKGYLTDDIVAIYFDPDFRRTDSLWFIYYTLHCVIITVTFGATRKLFKLIS